MRWWRPRRPACGGPFPVPRFRDARSGSAGRWRYRICAAACHRRGCPRCAGDAAVPFPDCRILPPARRTTGGQNPGRCGAGDRCGSREDPPPPRRPPHSMFPPVRAGIARSAVHRAGRSGGPCALLPAARRPAGSHPRPRGMPGSCVSCHRGWTPSHRLRGLRRARHCRPSALRGNGPPTPGLPYCPSPCSSVPPSAAIAGTTKGGGPVGSRPGPARSNHTIAMFCICTQTALRCQSKSAK